MDEVITPTNDTVIIVSGFTWFLNVNPARTERDLEHAGRSAASAYAWMQFDHWKTGQTPLTTKERYSALMKFRQRIRLREKDSNGQHHFILQSPAVPVDFWALSVAYDKWKAKFQINWPVANEHKGLASPCHQPLKGTPNVQAPWL